ncbi:MAG: alpha/beta hydrolase [Thermoanaerobaculia bacterium]
MGRGARAAGALLAALGLPAVLAGAAGPEELPRGSLIEKVTCRSAPGQSYALYLPPQYTADRAWPVLYAFDARGRALIPAERFQQAAAAWGWVVASSYGTRSDEKNDPSVEAIRAMWTDTRERLSLDDRRVYMTGFSGMARLAVALATNARGAVAGVIAVGAGFMEGAPPGRDIPFAWFGAAGERDFNYSEMRMVENLLANFGLPHRFRAFDGAHEWPPPDVCAEALAWMEIQAARKGARPRDDPALRALLRDRTAAAEALAASGRELEAFRAYETVARDFETLADVTRAKARSEALRRAPPVRRALREEERILTIEKEELGRAEAVLRDAMMQPSLPMAAALVDDLKIAYWRKKAAAQPQTAESSMADRILANLFVQTSYYLPQRYIERKDFRRAILMLLVATDARPGEPSGWIALARAQAKKATAGKRGTRSSEPWKTERTRGACERIASSLP